MATRYESPFLGREPGEEPSDEALLDEIAVQVDLPASVTAEAAARAVLATLAEQLTGGEARDLVDQLPPGLAAAVRPHAQHDEQPLSRGREEFLARAGQRLGIEHLDDIHSVCRGVFAVIRAHLSDRDVRGIRDQLTEELRGLWGPSA